jgi:hypothetical protein
LWTELQSGKTIADLAAEKGVESSAIVDAIVSAQQERLATAVTDGRLTQAQADARLALAKADADALLDNTFEAPDGVNAPGFGRDGLRFGGELLSVVADKLGIEVTDLRTEMQSGKTIADIAEEKGVETSAIVDAIVAAQQENLDQAVTDGRLTQEQADARLETFKTYAEAFINATTLPRGGWNGMPGMGGPGMGPHGNWGGFGGRGGFGGHGGPGQLPGAPNAPDAPAAPDSTTTPNA